MVNCKVILNGSVKTLLSREYSMQMVCWFQSARFKRVIKRSEDRGGGDRRGRNHYLATHFEKCVHARADSEIICGVKIIDNTQKFRAREREWKKARTH